MNKIIIAFILLCFTFTAHSQSIEEMKKGLEGPDFVHYLKFILKKQYKVDTINVFSTTSFQGTPDSLAYFGKEGKVYGPYKGRHNNYLVKILQKAPNSFYHISHIVLDTSVFHTKFADSLANNIIRQIRSGAATFAAMAGTYSADNTNAAEGGDLGWLCLDGMLPQLSAAISRHKKGDVFKVWTQTGIHIVTITDGPKQDTGFALMLKIVL